MRLQALIFDCDGVLAETERDGHRIAYNLAMQEMGIGCSWDSATYAKLVRISGGKERLNHYFASDRKRFPISEYGPDTIQAIYQRKTMIFKAMIQKGTLTARPGVFRLLNEAHLHNIPLFVCSTSHRESVQTLIRHTFSPNVLAWFTDLFCGDVVSRKKPASDVYDMVKDTYHLDPGHCCVIEDSRNGLLAAKGAGMHCIVTPSFYTKEENFSEADLVVTNLGDPDGETSKVLKNCAIGIEKYVKIMDIDELV
ncbi:MAG: HAD-IA family hydrolase [Sphaerochaetaceae bacterium]